jgi:nitrite reductase/ring-hydroxylating ferredoxin subunit
MKRAEGLVAFTRREFCALGALGLAFAGCTDGDRGIVQTGPLGGPDDNPDNPDSGTPPPPDGSVPMPDGGPGATCPMTGATDVGAPTTFQTNSPVYFSSGRYFVVRDAMGLYALTANCTHEGAACITQSGHFYCPRHGAQFTYTGAIITGPVSQPLKHYAMCTLANGHVGVVTSQVVSSGTRLTGV